jgi:hypothetical protein
MTREEAQAKLNSTMTQINSSVDPLHNNLIAQSRDAYAKRWGTKMSKEKEAVLKNSLQQVTNKLIAKNVSKEAIKSAVSDISKVDNPLAMLYNLYSILIPNFAYTEVCGVQPLPTKESPIFYPQITANENRNGITKGTALLGSTNWAKENTYTTNKVAGDATVSGTDVTFTAPEGSMLPNTLEITVSGAANAFTLDDGKENINPVLNVITSGTVNYETGAVSITLDGAASGAKVSVKYRYDWGILPDGSQAQKPAQIVLEWKSKTITANPYRLRSTYSLDDFYAAKQVLSGYDIDQVLATSLGGLINKEISCNIFDEMLARAEGTKAWNSILPSGVSQIEHNMSILQSITEASNEIRKNINRSGANWIIAGSKMMNIIEALSANFYNSKDIWSANSYSAEPIGPYVAGTLFNRYKVLKNQDFDDDIALMGYRRDDMDASYLTGSFISLYATNPLAKDDLTVVQGMGTQMGGTRAFENSMMKFVIE